MSSPTDAEVHRYIEEIVTGDKRIRKRLEKDVPAMCAMLSQLVDDFYKKVANERDLLQRLKRSFNDIYGSLKLHLKFHLGDTAEITELNTLGEEIGLTEEERDALPGIECAIDPGSKILEILSDITDFFDGPKGSESHANTVMSGARDLFSTLKAKNTFKPKVLTQVSHNGKWFVGSSMAVSHFLKPLCLYNRIRNFKKSLKDAVVDFKSLEIEGNVHWNSSSFWFKPVGSPLAEVSHDEAKRPLLEGKPVGYITEKPPCRNCKVMFKNLPGFLGGRDNLREEGDRETILAACGEYVPTNQCLPDDAESANKAENDALSNFLHKCILYIQLFHESVSKCDLAYESYKSEEDESRRVEILRNVYDTYVKDKIHIFGVKPECNGSLSHNVRPLNLSLRVKTEKFHLL